jgi:hypothetical protein
VLIPLENFFLFFFFYFFVVRPLEENMFNIKGMNTVYFQLKFDDGQKEEEK